MQEGTLLLMILPSPLAAATQIHPSTLLMKAMVIFKSSSAQLQHLLFLSSAVYIVSKHHSPFLNSWI